MELQEFVGTVMAYSVGSMIIYFVLRAASIIGDTRLEAFMVVVLSFYIFMNSERLGLNG